MSRILTLQPSAKVNLTLRVGPRRPDGFHDVRTLMQSIAVSDTLTFSARRGPFSLATRAPGVPADRTNIIWRAAEALWQELGRPGDPRDVHVRLEKGIPPAAGLGGGSADAAAALVGLNEIWDARRPRRDLLRLAAAIGSDVPFFLQGGTVLAAGRGDEIYPVDDVSRFGVVVVKPSFGVSTADAYRWLDDDRADVLPESIREVRPLDVGWPAGPIVPINDLEAPVARRQPMIAEMIEACLREGAMGAAMTGSGSAVYALFSEAATRQAVNRLRRQEWLVILTRTLTRREAERRMRL